MLRIGEVWQTHYGDGEWHDRVVLKRSSDTAAMELPGVEVSSDSVWWVATPHRRHLPRATPMRCRPSRRKQWTSPCWITSTTWTTTGTRRIKRTSWRRRSASTAPTPPPGEAVVTSDAEGLQRLRESFAGPQPGSAAFGVVCRHRRVHAQDGVHRVRLDALPAVLMLSAAVGPSSSARRGLVGTHPRQTPHALGHPRFAIGTCGADENGYLRQHIRDLERGHRHDEVPARAGKLDAPGRSVVPYFGERVQDGFQECEQNGRAGQLLLHDLPGQTWMGRRGTSFWAGATTKPHKNEELGKRTAASDVTKSRGGCRKASRP
mmetsp:Transcript_123627/g.357606  ORF Transcript_123627/g.357606 Transcript_123627/m.357606 type:complete len:319 (+) Transcript_123627:233-1189(+)